jgi:hypothetical protein
MEFEGYLLALEKRLVEEGVKSFNIQETNFLHMRLFLNTNSALALHSPRFVVILLITEFVSIVCLHSVRLHERHGDMFQSTRSC